MNTSSLRFRINALVTALVLVFFSLTAMLMLEDIRRQIREEMEATSRVTMQLLSTVVYSTQFVPTAMSRAEMVRGFLDSVGRIRAHDVTLYGEGGVRLYGSPPSTYKQGRKAPERFAALVGPDLPVLRLSAPGLRLVVTPDASRAILDAWDDVTRLAWLSLGFFVLANLLVYWIIGRALQPVSMLLGGLERMAAGDLGARVEGIDTSELRALGDGFNRMAAALEVSLRENETLALAMRQTSDAILLMSPTGIVKLCNPAAERLFGFAAEELAGLDGRRLIPDHLLPAFEADLAQLERGQTIEAHDTVRRTRMGRSLEVSYRASPLVQPNDGDHRVIGSVVAYHDISERRRAEAVSRELDASRQMAHVVQTHLEDERRALAMELHDELGQYVTAVKTIAQATANRTVETDPQTHASSAAIVSAAGQIYDAMHQIIRRLRPVALERFGLAETLRDAVNEWRKQYTDLEVLLEITGETGSISSDQQIALYRVAQECVTNVVKHAAASRVGIHLTATADQLVLLVEDNGRGIPTERIESSGRFGLIGMRDRVQALGGSLDVVAANAIGTSATETGTRVCARIPRRASKEN